MVKFKKILNCVRDALFPLNYTCDICGAETFGTNLCEDCLKTVTFNGGTCCPVCGRKTVRPEICLECKSSLPVYDKAVSALVYDGGGIAIISKFKNGYGYLKEYFADLLAEKIKMLPETDCILYVPATERSVKRRGYNQTRLLAKALAERLDKPVLDKALVKVKDTKVQKGLTRKERSENLHGAFKVVNAEDIKGKSVLLIDDVLTTGATADEVCSVLKKAGADKVYFATVASVEYKAIKD